MGDTFGSQAHQIQRPEFQVAHPPFLQGQGGFLTRSRHLLGANGTVVLVFNLEDVGVELAVLTIDLDANPFVGREGLLNGCFKARNVFLQ